MKKQYGQFFTTNSDYILSSFDIFVKNKNVIDPFAGNRDLINWSKKHKCKSVIGYDLDKKYVDNKTIFFNDSLNKPKNYNGKFICTNPPYLNKNKAETGIKNKFFYRNDFQFEDLYQISIFSILSADEGIIIVPLNFLSAENSNKIRNLFFDKFQIVKLNIFSEQVFDDTTYNVISFYFRRNKTGLNYNKIEATIFPENKKINFTLEKQYNWQFGGEFISRIKNTKNYLGVHRLTEDYIKSGEYKIELSLQNIKDKRQFKISKDLKKLINENILFLRAIDSKNGKKIQLEDIRNYGTQGLIGKESSRNMAHIIFSQPISINEQIDLMNSFNKKLNEERKKNFSFFLTNFRDNNRKRISFDFAYKLLNYIYYEKNKKQSALL